MCGEKRQDRLDYYVPQGSPPRMRGKAADLRQLFQISGITPAYAGKSFNFLVRSEPGWDHPRVCGEKTKKIP